MINGLNSDGVVLIPNNSKVRYNCPITGAHFEFNYMCNRIEELIVLRKEIDKQIMREKMAEQAVIQKQGASQHPQIKIFSGKEEIVSEEEPSHIVLSPNQKPTEVKRLIQNNFFSQTKDVNQLQVAP